MSLFHWLFGPPSQTEKKMCRNKIRYKTYVEAQKALKRINPNNLKANKPTRYYKCPHCSGYHLTRSPRK